MEDSIFNTFNKGLYKTDTSVYSDPSLATQVSSSSVTLVDPNRISSGGALEELNQYVGSLVAGKQDFTNNESGYILGVDKGIPKFYIGNSSNYLNWDGTTLSIQGTFVIGGTIITINNISLLQSAINTVNALGGGTVALVPGTYNATTSFTVPSNVTIDGNGATIDFGGGAFQFLIQGSNAYSTGTITATFGSTTITGSGTTWTSSMVGQSILLGDYWYDITAFTDTTHITIGSSFIGTNLSGDTYVIATTVDGVNLRNINLSNSSISLLKFRYVNGMVIGAFGADTAAQGIDGDDSSGVVLTDNSFIDNCTIGLTYDNVPFPEIDNFGVSNITGGTGMAFNRVSNSSIEIFSVQAITGVGVTFTNCYNLGVFNYSIIECTSHGIEFVSGNRDIDVGSSYIDTVGGDAIKLTATSDTIKLIAPSLLNYTGYGINIAAASCDNNTIISPSFGGGGSGTINDSGTGTIYITNPMTTTGDIVYRAATKLPTRLAVGGANTVIHGGTIPAYSAVVEADITLADNTTNDVSTSKHGFAPKGDGSTTKFLNANGAYSTPSSGGSFTLVSTQTISAVSLPTTTFTKIAEWTSLTGDTDDVYLIEFEAAYSTAVAALTIGVRLNDDSTSNHYDYSVMSITSASTGFVGVNSQNTFHRLMIGTAVTVSTALARIEIKASKTISGTRRMITSETAMIGSNERMKEMNSGAWTDTTNQITSVQIYASQSDGSTLSISGKASLYKINR